MELLIIIGLVLLNGVFAMAEMSLVSSRKFKLEKALQKGHKSAKIALELSENPTKFLSTVQIGITLIGILLGVYSGENLTNDVQAFLEQFEVIRPFAHNIAVVVIVVFVTYLSIVLGELFPKRLGLTFPEPIAMLLAPLMQLLSVVTSPFVWLLTTTNDLILKILGIKNTLNSKVTEEEIKSIIKESADGGEIQDIEHSIVERVFELGDRKANSLMTHQANLVFFNENDDLPTVRRKVETEKHSAYPVCVDNNIAKIQGIVLLKDLFNVTEAANFSLKKYVKKPLFITESMPAYKLLELFKQRRLHYAIVVDEFGVAQGIVTMDDVMDALVGDAREAHDDEYKITERDKNSWFVDGQYPLSEFLKRFNLQLEPVQQGKFVTVSGLLLLKSDALPKVGDQFDFGELRLEVADMDGQRVDKILVTKS
jgi:putative hemolysin